MQIRFIPLHRTALAVVTVTLALVACRGNERAEKAVPPPRDPNTPLAVVSTGLATPESVLWDAARKVWYVSNINGSPTAKDDNGYLVRLGPYGQSMDSLPFVSGADGDITLQQCTISKIEGGKFVPVKIQ